MKWRGGCNTHIHTPATAGDKYVGEVIAETSSSDPTENHVAMHTWMAILIFNGELPLHFLKFVLIS